MTNRPRTTPYAPPAEGSEDAETDAAEASTETGATEAETWPFERGATPAPGFASAEATAPLPSAPVERPPLFGPLPDIASDAPSEATGEADGAPAGEAGSEDEARATRVNSLENEMARLLGEIAGRKP